MPVLAFGHESGLVPLLRERKSAVQENTRLDLMLTEMILPNFLHNLKDRSIFCKMYSPRPRRSGRVSLKISAMCIIDGPMPEKTYFIDFCLLILIIIYFMIFFTLQHGTWP